MDRRQLIKHGAVGLGWLAELGNVAAQSRTLNIGVLPHLSARTMAEQYQPLHSYLSSHTHSVVNISSAADWNHFYKNVKNEHYDIVIAAAHVARVMQLELGLNPIASYHPNIKGAFIAAKASKVASPIQVRNRLIAWANPAALISLEAEKWLLTKYQMRKGDDYQCVPVRGADSVAYSLLNGQAPAGIVCLSDLEVQPQAVKRQISVIEIFAETPNFIVLAGQPLGATQSRLMAKRLQTFSDSSVEGKVFETRTGFRFTRLLEDSQIRAMDGYVEKTRRLLAA